MGLAIAADKPRQLRWLAADPGHFVEGLHQEADFVPPFLIDMDVVLPPATFTVPSASWRIGVVISRAM